jgi:phosphatidylglycerophosphatase A
MNLKKLKLFIFIPLQDYIWLAISIIMFFIGIWVSGTVEKDKGKDPGIVVIDEFVGQWIALLFLPRILWIFIAGFIVFRILDIIKPFPAADLEELDGGIGIMLDDIIVAIYTNVALHLTLIFIS